jgi:hypothetical protein
LYHSQFVPLAHSHPIPNAQTQTQKSDVLD